MSAPFGIRPFKGFTYVTAGLLTIALIGLIILPFATGHWHSHNVHATFTGPWGGTKQAFVYLFILACSAWAAEVCATFAPEYKTRQDTKFIFRRVVQDHEHVHFREQIPTTPEEEAALAVPSTPPAALPV